MKAAIQSFVIGTHARSCVRTHLGVKKKKKNWRCSRSSTVGIMGSMGFSKAFFFFSLARCTSDTILRSCIYDLFRFSYSGRLVFFARGVQTFCIHCDIMHSHTEVPYRPGGAAIASDTLREQKNAVSREKRYVRNLGALQSMPAVCSTIFCSESAP